MRQKLNVENNHDVSTYNPVTKIYPHTPFIAKWKKLEGFVEEIIANSQQNAIETLILISKQLKNHQEFHYTNYRGNKSVLKTIYHIDLPRRIAFAQKAITLNFLTGQQQNIYRNDISAEMVARIYARRIQDLHNPKIFPPQTISFQTIYHFMFEDFIRGISKPDGLIYLK